MLWEAIRQITIPSTTNVVATNCPNYNPCLEFHLQLTCIFPDGSQNVVKRELSPSVGCYLYKGGTQPLKERPWSLLHINRGAGMQNTFIHLKIIIIYGERWTVLPHVVSPIISILCSTLWHTFGSPCATRRVRTTSDGKENTVAKHPAMPPHTKWTIGR
jgi:hypothetical protein